MTTVYDFDSHQAKIMALELANEVGKGILKELLRAPRTASQLSEAMGIPLPTVLFHLSRLETTGIVRSKRALGKRLREVKLYSVPSTEIVFRIGGENHE